MLVAEGIKHQLNEAAIVGSRTTIKPDMNKYVEFNNISCTELGESK